MNKKVHFPKIAKASNHKARLCSSKEYAFVFSDDVRDWQGHTGKEKKRKNINE